MSRRHCVSTSIRHAQTCPIRCDDGKQCKHRGAKPCTWPRIPQRPSCILCESAGPHCIVSLIQCCFTLRCVLATGLLAGTADTEQQTLEVALQLLPSHSLAEASSEATVAVQTLKLPFHVQHRGGMAAPIAASLFYQCTSLKIIGTWHGKHRIT